MSCLRNTALLFLELSLLSVCAHAGGNTESLNLMPWPAKIEVAGGKYRLGQQFTVAVTGNAADRLYHGASRMLRRLSARTGLFFSQDCLSRDSVVEHPTMIIHVDHPSRLDLNEDESYRLEVTTARILLSAKTDIGALRGIETFLQLLEADSSGYYLPAVSIVDYPRFPWRGLMIDASRHFMPVDVIKRNIDGMAAVKMNVLHWHLSDDQGFRVECKTFPRLTEMGSDGLFYSQAQIKDVIQYAADRGIRVVPEFDLPAHSTSWFIGYPQYASAPGPYSIGRKWGVFDPVFDPTSEKTYVFLDKFFKEMSGLFPDLYVHIGGDENTGKQWDSNSRIRAFMKAHRITDDHSLQIRFEDRLVSILKRYHRTAIGWEEILNRGLPKNTIIQSWQGKESIEQATSKGYNVIMSGSYYLDHYQPVSAYYLSDPIPSDAKLTAAQKKLVIGGEACMWSEFVTPENIDSRIWPSAAAIAERLWSPRRVRNVKDMYRRLDVLSCEIEDLGLAHLKNHSMMIRRLANGCDPTALDNLVDVVKPISNYERIQTRSDYTSFAPLTRVVDAAVSDPEVARNFACMVDCLLAECNPNIDTVDVIERQLTLWKENDTALEPLITKSPILMEIKPLSKSLSFAASIGLEALHDIRNKLNASPDWVDASLSRLEEAAKPREKVELIIVVPIEKLVRRAGGR